MSSSNKNIQRQRSKAGAKILKSKKDADLERLEKQLAKAADIEAQMGALGHKKKSAMEENQSCKLRSHLCEVLSDILISSPKFSLEKDCFQRLWRGCFYNPIRIRRQLVSREKRKRSPSLGATQEEFKHFLSEAVTLYDYLVLQYLTKLVPDVTQTQQSRDTLSTTMHMNDRSSQLEDTQYASQSTESVVTGLSSGSSMDGVVHGLYKLYIFLGDLHRYGEAYNKAEANYLNASKLGPGLGNPYNQLAVVAFSKDTYCVAIYWYARSMLATHEQFSTSSNNLERLFASNREFLVEHGRDSTPTVFQNSVAGETSNSSKNNKNRNSANNSMLRAQKNAAIKSFLMHFVDLHYDLYLQQGNNKNEQHTNDDDDEGNNEKRLRERTKNVIASFRSLVQVSGFSDALLCKIVIINSFSLEHASSTAGAISFKSAISKRLAREFLLSLGLVLGEQVEKLLVKSMQKSAPNKPVPSVRCLLPFEILVDFITMRLEKDCGDDDKQQTGFDDDDDETNSIDCEFWKRVSVVGNLVRNLLKSHNASATGNDGFRRSASLTQIKEYQRLKGYRPFSVVNQEYLSNKDGFVDAMEAVEVLELSPVQSASQDTATVSAISEDGGNQESKAKLLRMLEICEHLALSTTAAPLVSENGSYVYQENSPSLATKIILENVDMDDEDDFNEGGNFADDDEDEGSDVVLHHKTDDTVNEDGLPSDPRHITAPPSSATGTGTENDVRESQETIGGQNRDITMTVCEEESPSPVRASLIKPPPGFGASPAIPSVLAQSVPLMDHHMTSISDNPPIDLPGLPPAVKNRNILDQVIQARIPAASSSLSSFQLPQQQDQSIIPIAGLSEFSSRNEWLYPSQSGRSNLPLSVEESIHIFGDMKTTNPFVVDPPPSAYSNPINNQNQNGNQNASIIPNFVTEDNYNSDDTRWLNSKLLNSLWMNETSGAKNT